MTWLLTLVKGLSSTMQALLAGAAGFGIAAALFVLWNAAIENPGIRRDVRAATVAEMQTKFRESVDDLKDKADRTRAELRYCTATGGLWDFEGGKCQYN